MNISLDIKENNARFLGLIFYSLINIILVAILIYFDYTHILKNKSAIDLNLILFNLLFLIIIAFLIKSTLFPLLNSIIRKFQIKDNYLNQIRINQELNNIKLAKELREKGKKPIINPLYSDSVKMHLGIKINKKKNIPFLKRLFRKKYKKS